MSENLYRGDYINKEFMIPAKPDGEVKDISPSDKKDLIMTFEYAFDHVNKAVEAAKKAFPHWAGLSLQERTHYLTRLKEVYTARKNDLAEAISRDMGKPLWEALTEAQAMIGKIDITLNESMKLVATQEFENALPGVKGVVRFKPRGVMAVLGPFNFPGHLPNGHIIPALITGNTVVFKPSEQTPFVGQIMAEMFHQADFPHGVFNMVQGLGETGRRLVAHELVDGILFTGSYDTGLKIKQETMTHYWKILALEMGGKNASLVWDDTDLDKAIYENLQASFLTTGQRCSCTSRLILHKNIYDQFMDKFYKAAKKLTIGHWKDNTFMGPLINDTAVENYLRFQGIAVREGAECLMRGKALDKELNGSYVTPSIYLIDKPSEKSVYQKTEIFGPNLAVYKTDDFDQSLELINSTGYGLVTSIFTKQKELYDKLNQQARVGLVNWNRGTIGASSRLPFGGMDKSGNDRPSAHFAVQYCTVPVANLEDPTPFDASKLPPGLEVIS
ncbi:MAG: succinylglutamate-semialdehyde dehydrogenase [Bdellovibrionota bacterium]